MKFQFSTNKLTLQSKTIALDKQKVSFKDLGIINYQQAWDYQEALLQHNVQLKAQYGKSSMENSMHPKQAALNVPTQHHLLFCEHTPVYTLGKSGHQQNILITQAQMDEQGIEYFKTNRGGDITFHGLGQIVGYPIFDLEKMYTDIGRYLRELEEVIILTLQYFNIKAGRSKGETGVWIEPDVPGKERKICAMGVRCSRWITMHGFALNVNTNLHYFKNIIPCGIVNKQVTSMQQELQVQVDMQLVQQQLLISFEKVFNIQIVPAIN